MRGIADTLGASALFGDLPKSVLSDVAEIVHRRTYKQDEVLYYEGDPGFGLYVIQRGSVSLFTEDEGTTHALRRVGRGEVLGTLSLLGEFQRTESARALVETDVLGLFRSDLQTLSKRHPDSGVLLLGVLARDVVALQSEVMQVLIERDGRVGALHVMAAAIDRLGGQAREGAVVAGADGGQQPS